MARRRWVEWASARMLCALVREGARVHAAAGVRTVAPPVSFCAWCPAKRVGGRCILRPVTKLPRVTKLVLCLTGGPQFKSKGFFLIALQVQVFDLRAEQVQVSARSGSRYKYAIFGCI